jgi:hypothetical protein
MSTAYVFLLTPYCAVEDVLKTRLHTAAQCLYRVAEASIEINYNEALPEH